MRLEYTDRTKRTWAISYAFLTAVLAWMQTTSILDHQGRPQVSQVIGSALWASLTLWYLWIGYQPLGAEVIVDIDERSTRIVRNGREIYSGVRLTPARIIEDGIAFHLHPPGRRPSFIVPKRVLTESQVAFLRSCSSEAAEGTQHPAASPQQLADT